VSMVLDRGSSDRQPVLRIIDANANRVREGLRVIEEYYRFVLDDKDTTSQLKALRHEVTDAVIAVADEHKLMISRDSAQDVGMGSVVQSEGHRSSLRAVVAAAFKRVEEGLRALEEYTKLAAGQQAGERFKTLRFEVYTLEKEIRLREDDRK